jgi:hypothetical protein
MSVNCGLYQKAWSKGVLEHKHISIMRRSRGRVVRVAKKCNIPPTLGSVRTNPFLCRVKVGKPMGEGDSKNVAKFNYCLILGPLS